MLYVGGITGEIVGLTFNVRGDVQPVLKYLAHRGKVCTIKLNQKYIVTGGEDNKVIVWEKTSLKKIQEYEHGNFVQDLHILDDKIISVSYDGKIKTWPL